jgi:hypothetical protein
MSFDVNAIDPLRTIRLMPERAPVRAAGQADPLGDAVKAAHAADAKVDTIPAAPPPQVTDQVLAAQKAIQEMHERGRTLHFSMDGGRVTILLQDLDGNVIREVPPSKAVNIANERVDD